MGLDLDNLFGAREVLSRWLGQRWGRLIYEAGVLLCFLALLAIAITTLYRFGKGGVHLFAFSQPPSAKSQSIQPKPTPSETGVATGAGSAGINTGTINNYPSPQPAKALPKTTPVHRRLRTKPPAQRHPKTALNPPPAGTTVQQPQQAPLVGTVNGQTVIAPNNSGTVTQDNSGTPH